MWNGNDFECLLEQNRPAANIEIHCQEGRMVTSLNRISRILKIIVDDTLNIWNQNGVGFGMCS